ncbi:alpha/beta hydrolase [Amycolatopsis sp., V23-08]|uniref:Alpha/beta hydrolase n=1 Tax=Amycolatopsis heterodermiae TaxID=3110235 RepID=A0ABU5R885_9PSEU|nr:alpha/beta hydrolase [Amycolatopsis sp., V23-08]MEA5362453.1 alpha/beta hydrolase [Amycolatopsis sp., V23-08]
MTLAEAIRWAPAEGVPVRGTVVLLPGRGEHPALYARLGTRLAFDGYRVTVPEADLPVKVSAGPGPVVLLGHDTGAVRALALAAHLPVDAVIASGLPLGGSTGWDDELDARTACPVHRALLDADDRFARGELHTPVTGPLAEPEVPVLVLHGEADKVAGPDAARAYAAKLPKSRFVLVGGGRHDVLNDVDHRSVAAEIVQFLEWRRAGTGTPALVRG